MGLWKTFSDEGNEVKIFERSLNIAKRSARDLQGLRWGELKGTK